jgi:hypothetical protein
VAANLDRFRPAMTVALRLAGAWTVAAAAALGAQAATPESVRCDSIVAASRVDSIASGIFISSGRIDGGALSRSRAELIARSVGTGFVPPKPFRLTVFTGPPRMRLLRTLGASAVTTLRAPTVTGMYRFMADAKGVMSSFVIVRMSLMQGFDSAAAEAIRVGSAVAGITVPPPGEDSMRVEVRISSDSSAGSVRLVSAYFPRMPVVDAWARAGNPGAAYPPEAARDSVGDGEAVFRFVVDRTGAPVMETLELLRATDLTFARSGYDALPQQRFTPASIGGCPVSQRVEYPFGFVAPSLSNGHQTESTRLPFRD